jgi:hypothetical protein
MGNLQFTNFATSTIADVGGIASGDLTVNVQAGDGALFPTLAGSQYFYAVLIDTSGNREIVRVTARATDALTITRAQDNTSARAFAENDKIELRVNAAALSMLDDLNGEELILDADGDTTVTADTDDQIDWKIGGTDQFSFKDGVIEPTTDSDIDLGAAAKKFKDAYIDEFDIDGTWKAAFPTNGVGEDAIIMLGLSTTILWMYLNAAPPGWKISTEGKDTVLGVKADSGPYNVNGGNPDSEATFSHVHTSGAHNHKWKDWTGAVDASWLSNGSSQTAIDGGGGVNRAGLVELVNNGDEFCVNQDYYTENTTPGPTGGSASYRPSASIGKLFQLDTA